LPPVVAQSCSGTVPPAILPYFVGNVVAILQVFTSRGFVAKLFLASSDLQRLRELDTFITQCMIDMEVCDGGKRAPLSFESPSASNPSASFAVVSVWCGAVS
jgi:hypothetical protein